MKIIAYLVGGFDAMWVISNAVVLWSLLWNLSSKFVIAIEQFPVVASSTKIQCKLLTCRKVWNKRVSSAICSGRRNVGVMI